MAFRDDLGAAHARADALERKVAELEKENELLREGDAEDTSAAEPGRPGNKRTVAVALAVCVAMVGAAAFVGGSTLVITVLVSGAVLVSVGSISSLAVACGPQEILVLSGRRYRASDGTHRGYRVISAGRVVVPAPLIEQVARMSTRPIAVSIRVENAYAKDARFSVLVGDAVVRVCATAPLVHHAIERFLGRDSEEMARVARETLEGTLRQVIAQLTQETITGDLESLARFVIEEAQSDLDKLGIALDGFEMAQATPAE